VYELLLFNNRIITVGHQSNKRVDLPVTQTGSGMILAFSNQLYRQCGDLNPIEIYNDKFSLVDEIEKGFFLYRAKVIDDFIFILSRLTQSFWKFLSSGEKICTNYEPIDFIAQIKNILIGIKDRQLVVYEPASGSIKLNLRLRISGDETDAAKQSDGICGNSEYLVFPLNNGQLLCLHASDGSRAWLKSYGDEGGSHVYFDGKVYRNNGHWLREIDIATGEVLKELNYKQSLPGVDASNMMGQFQVYEDVVVLKSANCVVPLYNRKNFNLIDFAQPNGWETMALSSDASVIRWNEGKLYVLNLNEDLFVYALD